MPRMPGVWSCRWCKTVLKRKDTRDAHELKCKTNPNRRVGGPLRLPKVKTIDTDYGLIQETTGLDKIISKYHILNIEEATDLGTFLESKQRLVKYIIQKELYAKKSVKVFMKSECVMAKPMLVETSTSSQEIEKEQNASFKICATPIYLASDVDEFIKESFQKMVLELEECYLKDSGLVLKYVDELVVSIAAYRPLGGSAFLELPENIEKRQAVLNPVNFTDEMCSKWAILAAYPPHNRNRINTLRGYEHMADFSCISYPTKVKEFSLFERRNPDFSINVFALDENEKVYGVRLVKEEKANHRDLLLLVNGDSSHYALITDFSGLVSKQMSKHNGRLYICKSCQAHYYRQERLERHIPQCQRNEPCVVEMPKLFKDKVPPSLSFKNIKNTQQIPFVLYADFESVLKTIEMQGDGVAKTKRCQEHVPFAYGINVVSTLEQEHCGDVQLGYQKYTGDDAAFHFVKTVKDISLKIGQLYKKNQPMVMSMEDVAHHSEARACYVCKHLFTEENWKTADHCHISGKYRGAACNSCNLQLKPPNFVPIVLHNLQNYDGHFIFRALCEKNANIRVIPSTTESFLSFSRTLYEIDEEGKMKLGITMRFIDSFKFLSASLDSLASDLQDEHFIEVKKHMQGEKLRLSKRKGWFPYDYVTDVQKLAETKLPPREMFYNKLTEREMSEEEYEEAQEFWRVFECKTLLDYAEAYMKIDILLLSDVFEAYRTHTMKHYELDSAWYITSPAVSWDSMLKMTKIHLELITDPDMLLMVENGIRGGFTCCMKRYAEAYNKYTTEIPIEEQKPDKLFTFLLYIDAINLYGKAMTGPLPAHGFEWVEHHQVPHPDTWTEDDEVGYILEVDVDYPNHLHFDHQDLPFLPENIVPPGGTNPKLCTTLYPKKRYVVHYMNLKNALDAGLVLKKVHRVIKFYQFPWMKDYINLNTELRNKATSKHAKNMFKLANNSCYGKSLENKRTRIRVEIVTDERRMRKVITYPDFMEAEVIVPGIFAVRRKQTRIYMDKPVMVGFAILESSKRTMYNFYYNVLKKYYGPRVEILYSDTDSYILSILTHDVYTDLQDPVLHEHFDTSDYPKDHPCYSEVNKNQLGKFRDELKGKPLLKFVGLRAKMYALIYELLEVLKAKGVSKTAVRRYLTFQDYVRCLLQHVPKEVSFRTIRSYQHIIYTLEQTKKALDHRDDKRYICIDGINTLPHGHFLLQHFEC